MVGPPKAQFGLWVLGVQVGPMSLHELCYLSELRPGGWTLPPYYRYQTATRLNLRRPPLK